jgi:hypothetical protein
MPLSRFSPSPSSGEYPDGDPHGGFNPNSYFAPLDTHHGSFNSDLNTFPPGGINLNGISPAHRCVPVGHGLLWHRRPGRPQCVRRNGRQRHAQHHQRRLDGGDAYTQEEGETIVDKEEERGEEGGKYDKDDEPVVTTAPPMVKGKRKAMPKKGGGSRGPKWRSVEDECLTEAWKTVSIDPISDANQNSDTYWERVKVAFDECKLIDSMFNKIHMDCNPFGMSHCWVLIQAACNKWHGIQQEVMDRQESGTSIENLVSRAPLLAGWHLHLFS